MAAFLLFWAALAYIVVRILRSSGYNRTVASALFLFAVSPYMVLTGHLIGYFDNLLALLTFTAGLLALRGRVWWASLVLAVSVFVHENIFVLGLPSIFFLVLLKESRNGPLDFRRLLRTCMPFALPLAAFGFLFLYQTLWVDAESLWAQVLKALRESGFIPSKNKSIANSFTVSFGQYLDSQLPLFLPRITSRIFVLLNVPVIAGVLALVAVPTFKAGRLYAALLTFVCLLPLSLHIIAWDVSRLWSFPHLATFLALWAAAEVLPSRDFPHARVWSALLIGIAAVTMYRQVPLMDQEIDRFGIPMRTALYLPALLLVMRHAFLQRSRKSPGPQDAAPEASVFRTQG